MDKLKQKLLIEQADRKLLLWKPLATAEAPRNGWINTIRKALKMSLKQLGARMNISAQSAKEIETREVDGAVTLKKLKEVAHAMDMKFVYGFVPNSGSIEKMIEHRAHELAKSIVLRASVTMRLEDQENAKERIEKAIQSRAEELINTLPKYLWD